MSMKQVVMGAVAALFVSGAAWAQEAQTLADIRQEASVLSVEIAKLKRELSTTGAPNTQTASGSVLERVDLMEAALSKVTAKLETLEFRINAVVKDGTNQLDDLNFRLCELEKGCDIGNLPPLKPLGGDSASGAVVAPAEPVAVVPTLESGGELAMTEQSDFDSAKALYEAGNYQDAAAAFARFAETYTGGPLTSEAHYMRGEALGASGQTADAARSYLESFSGNPEGQRAPDALLKLAGSMAKLGQTDKACVMFAEVATRFPDTTAAQSAQSEAQAQGCQ